MPDPTPGLEDLEQNRTRLYRDLSPVGDLRGALDVVWRTCGEPTCACSDPAHPGHGPQHDLTRAVAGKTVNQHLKPGPELEKVRGEVAAYRGFGEVVGEIVRVKDQICGARSVPPLAGDQPPAPAGARWGLSTELQAEFQREVAHLSELAARQLGDPAGRGLETVALTISTVMT